MLPVSLIWTRNVACVSILPLVQRTLAVVLSTWPHRLTARTSGSHPGNRGSIPREVTKDDLSFIDRSFLFGAYL